MASTLKIQSNQPLSKELFFSLDLQQKEASVLDSVMGKRELVVEQLQPLEHILRLPVVLVEPWVVVIVALEPTQFHSTSICHLH